MQTQTREEIELELLLLRHRRGDATALPEVIKRFERPLFYFLRRMLRDESQTWDALQKTWLSVLANPPSEGNGRSLKVWLFRVARNCALNHLRDERRHDSHEMCGQSEIEEPTPRFDSSDAEEIHVALDQLEQRDREVLTLHFLESLSTRELAEVLEIPQGTVKWRLHVAKKNLRTILEQK